jgi:two-component system OmpR family sensor kinase
VSAIPLRWRLAGAFTGVAAVVLVVLGVFLHGRLRAELDASLRAGLRQRAADLVVVARDRPTPLGSGPFVEPGDDLAQVLGPRGRVIDGAPGFDRVPLLTPSEVRRAGRGPLVIDQRHVGDEEEPATLLAAPAGARVVVIGASLEDRDDALAKLDGLLAVGLPAGLLLAAIAGFLVAGRALGPIDRMRARAEAISTEDLGRRLPEPPADDELRRLAVTLNAMLGRLEDGFARERTFVADASHELRTPLAALKAELELARRPNRSPAELRAAVDSAAEETDRLARLAEDLLVVARADAGRLPIRREPIDLPALLNRVAARAAGPVGIDAPAGLLASADPLRLEQALGNLVDNALRHGAPPVTLSAAVDDDRLRLQVGDRGAGLPPGLGKRAFDRFTRGDAAREGPGAGLGLAIVAAVAHAHAGRAGLDARPGGGTLAWLELPHAAASERPRDAAAPAWGVDTRRLAP